MSDPTREELLDDLTILEDKPKKPKKQLTEYEKAQRTELMFQIIKWVAITIVVLLTGYGGCQVVHKVVEVGESLDIRETTRQKARAVMDDDELKTTRENINSTFDNIKDRAFAFSVKVQQAVHDDGGINPDEEISAGDYEWIKLSWSNACPSVYKQVQQEVKDAGGLTRDKYNDFLGDCADIIDAESDQINTERKVKAKQELIGD